MHHQGTITLETERLILRRFTVADAPAMYRNWASSEEVAKFLTWAPHENEQVTADILKMWIADYEKPDCYNWVLELKSEGIVIGNISVVRIYEETACAALGWCLGTAWWGRGYMPEAANAVLQYLFETVGMNRICANHDIGNPKSGRVMQKIGIQHEGTLRQHGFARGRVFDDVWYGILADDYRRMMHDKAN